MKFSDIPQLTRSGSYCIDIPLKYLKETVLDWVNERAGGLNLDPDYQRDHVWTLDQRVRYVEFILRGGRTNNIFYFNCPGWMKDYRGPFELVDGKQRLTSLLMFLDDEFEVFGHKYSEIEGHPGLIGVKFQVNDLKTRKEVLQWYVDMNAGGTVHTTEEIEKVKLLMERET